MCVQLAPVARPVSFGRKIWAQIASSFPFHVTSLVPFGAGLLLSMKLLVLIFNLFSNSGLADYMVSLECSMELLSDQVSEILRKLSFVDLVLMLSPSHVFSLVVNASLNSALSSNMAVNNMVVPSFSSFPVINNATSNLSLNSGYLDSGVTIVMNNSLARHISKVSEVSDYLISIKLLFKNKLSVLILGLYTGASSTICFFQADVINSFITKATNEFTFVILGSDFNKDSSHKSASFKKCVGKHFDTNYHAVSVSVDLSGLLDMQLNSFCKQTKRDYWKFDIKNANEVTWNKFKDAMVDTVRKVVSLLANSGYDKVFTKELFRFHKLEVLVLKLAKTFHEVASVIQVLVGSNANSDCICSALFGVRKSYCASKLAEFLHAEKLDIRFAIEKWMKSFIKVVLDHLVFDGSLIVDPVDVKNNVNKIIENWTKKKVVPYNISDSWQCQYLPLDYVNNNVFSGIMDSISYENLKHCDGSVLGILLDLLNFCLVCESVPQCWKEAWVSIIPKLYKPIVLIKTAHKVLSKLLSDRILLAYSVFNVFRGDNFFMLKGTSTQSPIFAISLVVKDALEKNCKLWLVLQNMQKTYDSVDWHHLQNSLVWIKMCDLHNSLDQDEVFSPLLWRIFYDLLLCKIKRQKSLCRYCIDFRLVAKTGRLKTHGGLILFLTAGAFVDDTIWVESSQATTQYILDVASEFFGINNISINNKKTVIIPINRRVKEALLSISGMPISIAYRGESHKYLGIYLSSENLSKPSLTKVHSDIKFFVNLVLKKAILDKQFLYLVLAVLQSIVDYRSQFSFLSKSVYIKWNALIRKNLRLKAGLSKNFLNEALHHPSLYGLKSFEQLQTESKMASMLSFSNAVRLHVSPVNNFLTDIIRIFLSCDVSLGNFSYMAFYFFGGIPMSSVLRNHLFYEVLCLLKKFGVVFVKQLHTKKGLIFDWKSFHHWKKLNLKDPVSYWFSLARDFLAHFSPYEGLSVVELQLLDVGSLNGVL
ncbi:hypothetical protein G9A89_022070 [Geosiphon pyriformis]|nr:hypothetical protein G9A89_022070 [Geosiphon pyriformis]